VLEGCGFKHVYVFRNRLPMFHRDGWQGPRVSSAIAYCWLVWDATHTGPTTISRISWEKTND
jgi:hypothetical protein